MREKSQSLPHASDYNTAPYLGRLVSCRDWTGQDVCSQPEPVGSGDPGFPDRNWWPLDPSSRMASRHQRAGRWCRPILLSLAIGGPADYIPYEKEGIGKAAM